MSLYKTILIVNAKSKSQLNFRMDYAAKVHGVENYRTVFEISFANLNWGLPLNGAAFLVAGVGLIWFSRTRRWPFPKRLIGYFFVFFALIWLLSTFGVQYSQYASLRSAYRKGDYLVVRGVIYDFKPMPYEGHTNECFSAADKRFCYSDYELTPGFHNARSHGGPIQEGLPVRVSYVGDTIVRLEVAEDAAETSAMAAARSKSAEGAWQRRIAQDPLYIRMNLGFAMAAVFIAAWWNLQWKRFMKFWIKPPYKHSTILLFRLFFALNLIGAVIYLIAQFVWSRSNPVSYLQSFETGLTMIGVIWLMVNAVECMNKERSSI